MIKANKHVMVGVEPDDGGTVQCLGCRQYVHGSLTGTPPGECPTPYKSPKQLLDEALAREAALREELAELADIKAYATIPLRQRCAERLELKARLTAAEQRNAELVAVVRKNHEWHILYDEHGGYAESALHETNTAALKPTESGASDELAANAQLPN